MKPKTLALLAVAVGCGLLASYMASRVIAERGSGPEVARVPVVYATKNVPQGQLVKNPEEHFEVRMIPEDVAPRGKVIRDLNELKDKRLIDPVGSEKHVSHDDLLSNDSNVGLTYRIPPGMRAVSVRVSQDTSVAGFVQPGTFVDIVCVPHGRIEAKTILQRVQVLAVNALDRRDPERPNLETHFVTFAVTPDDGEKMTLASHSGHLRLMLRHTDDDKVASTKGAKADDLLRPSLDSLDNAGQPDVDTTQPIAVPTLPNKGTETAGGSEPTKMEPPKPKLLHVMVVRNGPQVVRHNYFDEPEIAVEKSDPEATTPGRNEPAPGSKPKEPMQEDLPASTPMDRSGNK